MVKILAILILSMVPVVFIYALLHLIDDETTSEEPPHIPSRPEDM